MGTFGSGFFGAGYFGGAQIVTEFTTGIPVLIDVYDNSLGFKQSYQSGPYEYVGCKFALDEAGCRNFRIIFTELVDIDEKDIVKIYIFGSDDPIFTGVVRDVPITGSTVRPYSYSGFGLNDYFLRLNTGLRSYTAPTNVATIVEDLLDNIIVPNTPITKDASKIDGSGVSVTDITFKYVSIKQALDILKNIAESDGNTYLSGVDEEGDFIFETKSTAVIETLVVGKDGDNGIRSYRPIEINKAVSKYYLLDKDGTFIQAITSTESIDINEKKLTAPDISNTDAVNWANGILKQNEQIRRQATIEWDIEKIDPTLLVADGSLRIISNVLGASVAPLVQRAFGEGFFGQGLFGGGEYPGFDSDDTLTVKRVTYNIDNSRAYRTIELGDLPVELDRQVLEVNKRVTDLTISLGR